MDDMAFIHFFTTRFLGSHPSSSGCGFPTGGEGWVLVILGMVYGIVFINQNTKELTRVIWG